MSTPAKGRADYYAEGDWNATCWECGRKRKASTMRKNWQGYWVCPEHWEPRHPQEFVRPTPENPAAPWSQPQEDAFVLSCTIEGVQGVAGLGVAGCAIAGKNDYLDPSQYSYCSIDSVLCLADLAAADCAVVERFS